MLTSSSRQRECWFVSSSPDHHRSWVSGHWKYKHELVTVISILILCVSVTWPALRTFFAPANVEYTKTHSRLKECIFDVFICRGIRGEPFKYFRSTVHVRPSAYLFTLHLTAARSRCKALHVRRPFNRKSLPLRVVTAEIVNLILLF